MKNYSNELKSKKITRHQSNKDILDLVTAEDPTSIKQYCPVCKIRLIPNPEATTEEDSYAFQFCSGCGKTFSLQESTKRGRLTALRSNEDLGKDAVLEPLLERGSARRINKRDPNYNNIEGFSPNEIPRLGGQKDTELERLARQGYTILSTEDYDIDESEVS